MNRAQHALAVRDLSKTFGVSRALDHVTVGFRRSRVTALLGPNGCGKSTLIKILAGFHSPDGGDVEIGGEPIETPIEPQSAHARGLRFVHQDLGLIEQLSVSDNLALAHAYYGTPTLSRLRRRAAEEAARQALEVLELDIDPRATVGKLSQSDQIMVAIARAFQVSGPSDHQTVILDEPTASLPAEAVDRVLAAVDKISSAGGTVIYVTHRIDEVVRIADDVVVLRDGVVAAERDASQLDAGSLSDLLFGAMFAVEEMPSASSPDEVVLDVESISGSRIKDVTFDLHRGEILGVAGLAGCGRSELSRLLAGVQPIAGGSVLLEGSPVSPGSPREALEQGIAYVPPDRATMGSIPEMSVRENVTLSDLSPFTQAGHLLPGVEKKAVGDLLERYEVRPRDTERRFQFLSGGNQQKAIIAKYARLKPQILIVDEPTQGVDISGKKEIARVLRDLAVDGCSVLLASSDLDEIGELCDRVLVLDRGRLVGVFERGEINEKRLSELTMTEPLRSELE